jgi:hypothetical protein
LVRRGGMVRTGVQGGLARRIEMLALGDRRKWAGLRRGEVFMLIKDVMDEMRGQPDEEDKEEDGAQQAAEAAHRGDSIT